MFGKHPDNMPPESTPERVFALIKLVSVYQARREELKNRLVMKEVFGDHHQDVFSKTVKYADELDLIKEKDGIVKMKAPINILDDYDSFRSYVAKIVFHNHNTTFFKFTEWYLAKNEEVYSFLTWEGTAANADKEGVSVKENDMLGWRWWASFLGLGYLHGTTLISNLAVRISDCLIDSGEKLPRGENIPAAHFISFLDGSCPEAKKSRNDNLLGLGVSNGLIVLEEKGVIELISQRDATKVNLFPTGGSTKNDFSHVIIKE